MKSIVPIIILSMLFFSCEDVIDVELDEGVSRLVIDASMELNSDGTTDTTIQLTRSSSFYTEDPVIVENAEVTITSENGNITNIPYSGNGIYSSNISFLNDRNDTSNFTLRVVDGSNIYVATESLEQTVPFNAIEQETITGLGDDLYQIKGFYNDPAGTDDFYLFEYSDPNNLQIDTGDDEFTEGNEAQTIFFIEDLEPGTLAELRIIGIDQGCYNFYETLLTQTDNGGGPFSTPPAIVRGNIINTIDTQLYPFGYFRISEVFKIDYTIQE